MVDVFTINGSPSIPSRSAAVLRYARETLEAQGLRSWELNVRDLPLEDLIYGRFGSPAIAEQAAVLSQARAVLVSTPVYKGAYSGVLKTFLDLLPQGAFANKLVVPIATGGSPGHLLAIDYALRPVLGALGAHYILSGVYITDTQIQFSPTSLTLDPAIQHRLDSALALVSEHLNPSVLNDLSGYPISEHVI